MKNIKGIILSKEERSDAFVEKRRKDLRDQENKWFEFYKAQGKVEEWKPAVGLDGYECSNFGRFRKIGSSEILLASIQDNGRFSFGGDFSYRIIAKTWIENDDPAKKVDVDHIIEDKSNNTVWNLQWLSHADNCKKVGWEENEENKIWKQKFYDHIQALRDLGYKEEWKYFNDGKNSYRYSNFGAFERKEENSWIQMKVCYNCSTRFYQYAFQFNGKSLMEYVHRMTAFIFIKNEDPTTKNVARRFSEKEKWQNSIFDLYWGKGKRFTNKKGKITWLEAII